MGDHPDAHAEECEHRTHPLRVAPGQVVVDGDDMDAAAGHRVEDRGQRRDEGLALAGPHLGDLALVEDGAADELDVEVAHPERPLHGLADHREDLGEDVVERGLDGGVLALAARLRQLAAALEVRVRALVLGRLLRDGDLEDLGADVREPRPDLVVGEGLDLGLERVRLVDRWLDASDLAVVRVDESGKELHGTAKYTGRGPQPPRDGLSARSRCRTPRRGSRRSGAPARPRTAPTSAATSAPSRGS